MPHKPKTVVNVTLQGDEWDYDERVTLGGQRFRLVRVGTSGDAAAAEEQVSHWSQDANAIAVSGLREARAAGHFSGRIEDLQRITGAATQVPAVSYTPPRAHATVLELVCRLLLEKKKI